MTLHIEYETTLKLDMDYGKTANTVVAKVLEWEEFPYEAEVNLIVTDNQDIKAVNEEFRDVHAPTDVLSFPMIPFEQPGDYSVIQQELNSYIDPDTGNVVLGDIMISAEKVISQAEQYGHSITREFAFLVAHSMLHLLGYDHMTEEEASVMEGKQKQILEQLGITR